MLDMIAQPNLIGVLGTLWFRGNIDPDEAAALPDWRMCVLLLSDHRRTCEIPEKHLLENHLHAATIEVTFAVDFRRKPNMLWNEQTNQSYGNNNNNTHTQYF